MKELCNGFNSKQLFVNDNICNVKFVLFFFIRALCKISGVHL